MDNCTLLNFRAQSLPVVKIVRCSGISLRKGQDKKDLSSKGLRKRLSKATSKLFNRKSFHAKDAGHHEDSVTESGKGKGGGIDNLGANIIDPDEGRASYYLNGDNLLPFGCCTISAIVIVVNHSLCRFTLLAILFLVMGSYCG